MFQQAITNFKINYDVYNESRTFFSGDRVTGNISFELKKEIKISTISMEFRGKAHVHWSSGGGGKKRSRRHFTAKLDYFRIKSSILQDSGGMQPPRQSCALNFWWGNVWCASSCSSSWGTQTSAWHACLSVHTSDPARVCTSMLLWSCVLFLTQAWLFRVVECWLCVAWQCVGSLGHLIKHLSQRSGVFERTLCLKWVACFGLTLLLTDRNILKLWLGDDSPDLFLPPLNWLRNNKASFQLQRVLWRGCLVMLPLGGAPVTYEVGVARACARNR